MIGNKNIFLNFLQDLKKFKYKKHTVTTVFFLIMFFFLNR